MHDELSLRALEDDPSVIFTLDSEFRIASCNRAWDEFAAANEGACLEREFVRGRSVFDFIAGDLSGFFRRVYGYVLETGTPWRHRYECSSPDVRRQFTMHVYPVEGGKGLMVVNSLISEQLHEGARGSAVARDYRGPDGMIVMCSNCRRTMRPGAAPAWDWVPDFVAAPPPRVSHGLCPPCSEHYHIGFSDKLSRMA